MEHGSLRLADRGRAVLKGEVVYLVMAETRERVVRGAKTDVEDCDALLEVVRYLLPGAQYPKNYRRPTSSRKMFERTNFILALFLPSLTLLPRPARAFTEKIIGGQLFVAFSVGT